MNQYFDEILASLDLYDICKQLSSNDLLAIRLEMKEFYEKKRKIKIDFIGIFIHGDNKVLISFEVDHKKDLIQKEIYKMISKIYNIFDICQNYIKNIGILSFPVFYITSSGEKDKAYNILLNSRNKDIAEYISFNIASYINVMYK